MSFIKLVEIYEEQSMERYEKSWKPCTVFRLREIAIEPSKILLIRGNEKIHKNMQDAVTPEDLSENQEYTTLYFDTGASMLKVDVVGDVRHVCNKMNLGGDHG